jgi:hypothetical protein
MWPEPVEEVAAVFRAAEAEARIEELAPGEHGFPGPGVRAEAYDCEGRLVVVLVPVDRHVDRLRIPCAYPRPVTSPPFPYRRATVLLERTLLAERTVWVEAGSPRYAAILAPALLVRLTAAQVTDLVAETARGTSGSPG